MTQTNYEYMVIEEEKNEYIEDLTVNPLDSILFYIMSTSNVTNTKGKIMKASPERLK
jgi:hypothetical protein